MKKYQIVNSVSGVSLGVWEGNTPTEAHGKMLIQAGYTPNMPEFDKLLNDPDIEILEEE